jgi:hypothetical protein
MTTKRKTEKRKRKTTGAMSNAEEMRRLREAEKRLGIHQEFQKFTKFGKPKQ